MKNLYDCVKDLEDRYYDTAMAWEKELRDVLAQNRVKQERIQALEGQIGNINMQKNDLKIKLDVFSKDLQFLKNGL